RLVEGEQAVARPAVRFEAPDRGLPQRGRVAVAMDEHDRRALAEGARGGAGRQDGGGEAEGDQLATRGHEAWFSKKTPAGGAGGRGLSDPTARDVRRRR